MLGICFFTLGGEYTAEPVWQGEKGVDVLQVFAKELMNRPARVMMPAMLDAIRIVNHPFHEEAKRTMRIILDQDHGDNIPQWESAMNAFLEKEAN